MGLYVNFITMEFATFLQVGGDHIVTTLLLHSNTSNTNVSYKITIDFTNSTGPLFDTDVDVQDQVNFISLELIGGYPRLRINLGDGEAMVTVNGRNAQGQERIGRLNDGKWHTIEVIKNRLVQNFVVT